MSKDGGGRVLVGGISVSHPDRVIYPDLGLTKLALAVAAAALVLLRRRSRRRVRQPRHV
jgi:DNA primase